MELNDLEAVISQCINKAASSPVDVRIAHSSVSRPLEFGGEIVLKITPTKLRPRVMVDRGPDSSQAIRANPGDDSRAFLLAALNDWQEKANPPFVALSWFKAKYLPALGASMSREELEDTLTALIARGDVLLEPVVNTKTGRDTTTIRTLDMPVPRSSVKF